MTATPLRLGNSSAPALAPRSRLAGSAESSAGQAPSARSTGGRRRAGETRRTVSRRDRAEGRGDSRASQDRLGLGKLPRSPSLGGE